MNALCEGIITRPANCAHVIYSLLMRASVMQKKKKKNKNKTLDALCACVCYLNFNSFARDYGKSEEKNTNVWNSHREKCALSLGN